MKRIKSALLACLSFNAAAANQNTHYEGYTSYAFYSRGYTNAGYGGMSTSNCTSSLAPQEGAYSASSAFNYATPYADIIALTDKSNLFDASTSASATANPDTVKALYQNGLSEADAFNASNSDYAIYAQEWGDDSGYIAIFGSQYLINYEYNSQNQLLGDVSIQQDNYFYLYEYMYNYGLIGQFVAPTSALFNNMSTNIYSKSVMKMAEINVSNPLSKKTDRSETSRTSYESGFNKLLEKGFFVSPTASQANRCANWGAASTNTSYVFIKNGIELNESSIFDAIEKNHVAADSGSNWAAGITFVGKIAGDNVITGESEAAISLNRMHLCCDNSTLQSIYITKVIPGVDGSATVYNVSPAYYGYPIPLEVGINYIYAKFTDSNGGMSWTAPLSITRLDPDDYVFLSGFEQGE